MGCYWGFGDRIATHRIGGSPCMTKSQLVPSSCERNIDPSVVPNATEVPDVARQNVSILSENNLGRARLNNLKGLFVFSGAR